MNARTVFLIGFSLLAVALAVFLPAMPQPLAYHDFADQREAYGIENFLDVTSNLAFAVAGLAGLVAVLRPASCFATPAERWPYLIFALAVLATAAGSCYYHLQPTNEKLFWDRLPMTIASCRWWRQIVDRVNARIGLMALVPMVLAGIATVVYWIVTERLGRGNVMPYAVLQGYAVLVLLEAGGAAPVALHARPGDLRRVRGLPVGQDLRALRPPDLRHHRQRQRTHAQARGRASQACRWST